MNDEDPPAARNTKGHEIKYCPAGPDVLAAFARQDRKKWDNVLNRLQKARGQAEEEKNKPNGKARAFVPLDTLNTMVKGLERALAGQPPYSWRPNNDPVQELTWEEYVHPEDLAAQYVLACREGFICDHAHTKFISEIFGVEEETVHNWVNSWRRDNPEGLITISVFDPELARADLKRASERYKSQSKRKSSRNSK